MAAKFEQGPVAETAQRQPPGMPTEHNRIRSLDALRGLAALAVVLYHYFYGYQAVVQPHTTPLLFSAFYGHLGVELFFIISGFVILRTLERCHGPCDFTLSRFARLYPAYLASSCITLVVLFGIGFNPQHIGLLNIAASFAMVSSLVHGPPIDPSYWTLTYEVLFYAGACVTYLMLGIRRIEVACLTWLAIGLIDLTVLPYKFNGIIEGSFSYLFVLGMMIFLISQRRGTLLTVITVIASLAMSLYLPPFPPSHLSSLETTGIIAVFGGSVLGAAEGRLRILCVRPLLFLGDISYSLYLVHQIAGYALIKQLEVSGLSANLAILVTITAAIGLATCLRYGVELPAQRAIKRFGRRRLRIGEHISYPSPIVKKTA